MRPERLTAMDLGAGHLQILDAMAAHDVAAARGVGEISKMAKGRVNR